MSLARICHSVTFVIAAAALVLQTVLVVHGSSVLDETDIPPLGDRLLRLVSYFTIQSNVLVAIVTAMLARDPARDGPVFRVLRLDAVIGITVTGVVHWFLLRPLLDLEGLHALCDTLLHVVVPLLAMLGWLGLGPRPRTSGKVVAQALIWPVAWLGYTLLMGALTGFYPYPFVNAAELGYARVLVNAAGITLLFLALLGLAVLVDRRLPPAPRGAPASGAAGRPDPAQGEQAHRPSG